jgi:hypothetical protein
VADVKVEGARELASTLGRAVRALGDLGAAQNAAGQIIAARASSAAPRLTGRLASSVDWASTRGQLEVASDVPYAGVQNYGYPPHHIRATLFLTNAVPDTEAQWMPAYEHNVQAVLDDVQGA